MTTDLDLLGQYARENSQEAFGELVRRHLDLVYSAALRQVRSPQLAEEVAQSVFADLARVAATSSSPASRRDASPLNSLTPWLYAVTRRTAIDAIRKESRRQQREQTAVEMNAMNATASDWLPIEPLLDDAMESLDAADRSAVLLRYFENKSLREVGEALGTSDDTAQKRVSRAVERLREFFTKRNVTVGASGLAVLISANAVQAAPVGLAVTISSAAILAGTSITTTATATAIKTIAMTTLQKTIIGTTLAVIAGTGIYEAHQAAQLREQNQTLQQQQAPLAEQIRQLQHERDEAANRLAALQAENMQLKSGQDATELLKLRGEVGRLRSETQKSANSKTTDDTTNATMKEWTDRVNQLKQLVEQRPNLKVPEFQFLTDNDWMRLGDAGFRTETEDDIRLAIAMLRSTAKSHLAGMIGHALNQYIAANNGQLPGDLSELNPYFSSTVDPAMLQRYQLLHTGKLSDYPESEPLVAEKAPVDDEYDILFDKIGPHGFTSRGIGKMAGNGGTATW